MRRFAGSLLLWVVRAGATVGVVIVCFVVGGFAGCGSSGGDLAINFSYSPQPNQHPLNAVAAYVRVRVDAKDNLIGPQTFAIADRQGRLDGLPTESELVVTAEGLGPENNPVSRGRSAPLTLPLVQPQTLTLYLGLLEQFSRAPAPLSSGKPTSLVSRLAHQAVQMQNGDLMVLGGSRDPWRVGQDLPQHFASNLTYVNAHSLLRREFACDAAGAACPKHVRFGHTATRLPSGNIVIVGGYEDSSAAPLRQIDIYQQATEQFFSGTPLRTPRAFHRAVLWQDQVVVVGGYDGKKVIGLTETFTEGAFEAKPQLVRARAHLSLSTLLDDRLWVVGGIDDASQPLTQTEVLMPSSAQWQPGPTLAKARWQHTVSVMQNGSALVVGGLNQRGEAVAEIELWDGHSAKTTIVGQLRYPRWGHQSVTLPDGRLFIIGGFSGSRLGSALDAVEVIQLTGATTITIRVPYRLNDARGLHTATLLGSRNIFVIGGMGSNGQPLNSAEVFTP